MAGVLNCTRCGLLNVQMKLAWIKGLWDFQKNKEKRNVSSEYQSAMPIQKLPLGYSGYGRAETISREKVELAAGACFGDRYFCTCPPTLQLFAFVTEATKCLMVSQVAEPGNPSVERSARVFE
jgi:hypothetical protein